MQQKSLYPALETRRLFLAGAGALALMPGAGLTQTLRANPAPEMPLSDEENARLAARRDIADRLMVEVRINGAGPFRFVVDTGAERSVIADNVAGALGLPAGKAITVNGISGQVQVSSIVAEAVTFGPFVRHNIVLPVLSRTYLQADGFLGLDALDGTRVLFDFLAETVEIEQPRGDSMTGMELEHTRVKATGSKGYLRVMDCVVDGVFATAFIDSGAEVSVGNLALKAALKTRHKNMGDLGHTVLTGVTQGQLVGEVLPVSRIRLQGLVFSDGSLVIADVPDFINWRLLKRPGLLIGMDYLRQFASVAIDYRNKSIRFDLSQSPPRPRPGVQIVSKA